MAANVKLAQRALIPLALWERAGVREMVMANRCFIIQNDDLP